MQPDQQGQGRNAAETAERTDWPLLLVVSAASGAGKTTLCQMLLREFKHFRYSVSCTTRPARVGEVDGRDYHFLTPAAFEAKAQAGEFMEHALVHGFRYGTLKQEAIGALEAGWDVLMDIDVQGAAHVRETIRGLPEKNLLRRAFTDVFITVPSLKELRNRLVLRGKDSMEVIERRVQQAEVEMSRSPEYRFCVANDQLGEAYEKLRAVVMASHVRARSWNE